jgi:hypothetical protein
MVERGGPKSAELTVVPITREKGRPPAPDELTDAEKGRLGRHGRRDAVGLFGRQSWSLLCQFCPEIKSNARVQSVQTTFRQPPAF